MMIGDDARTTSGEGLTNYMTKHGHELRGPHGQEMTDEEVERFHEKSEDEQFTRHFTLAPKRSDFDDEELDRAARKTMEEWREEKGMDDMEYCYAVHNDEGNSHVHVAATASKDSGDLWMEEDELNHLEDEIAADHFDDHSLERQQKQVQEREQREKEQRQRGRER